MLAVKGGGVLLVKLGEGDNLAALIAERLINKMQVRCCIFTIFVECNKMFGKIRKENISAFSKSQKYPRFQISSHQTAPTVLTKSVHYHFFVSVITPKPQEKIN